MSSTHSPTITHFLECDYNPGDVALFDFDQTIVMESSLVEWSKGRKLASVIAAFKALIFDGTTAGKVIRKYLFQSVLNGMTEKEMRRQIIFVARKLQINPLTKAFIDNYIDKGVDVYVVTASPQPFVTAILEYLGIEVAGVIGTELERKDGSFTGKIIGDEVHGNEKKHVVGELLPKKVIRACFGNLPEDNALLRMGEVSFSVNKKSGEFELYLNQRT
jgi:HAD superfamily phosphoserine phosphatase-like hydrolase